MTITSRLTLRSHVRFRNCVGVAKLETVRGGGDPPYHAIAELWYDDEEAMAAAAESPEYQRALADQPNFNTGGSVAWVCRVVD